MGLLTRLFGKKKAPIRGRGDFPLIWPITYSGEVKWTLTNYGSYVEEGFNQNPLIYSAIMYKVRAVAQIKLRLVDGNKPAPDNHSLLPLLNQPNLYQNWLQLIGLVESYLNIAGNAYLFIQRDNRGKPVTLYTLRPDRVYILVSPAGVQGYSYRPEGATVNEGIPMLLEDVIHFKFPNPADPYDGLGYGLSPISALAKSADVDNSVSSFLKSFFDRGALPAGILQYDIPLDRDQIQGIKDRWRQVYGGYENWADVGILDNGAKYSKLGYSFSEIGFEIIDDRNESRVLGPFGVPPILLGTKFGLKSSTFSNFDQARKSFWEDTMMYELGLIEAGLTQKLGLGDGVCFKFDVTKVPALMKDTPPLVEAAYKLFSMGVPPNLAFETVGLTMPEYEHDDIQYVPLNLTPIGAPPIVPIFSQHVVQPKPKGEEEGEGEGEDDEKRINLTLPLSLKKRHSHELVALTIMEKVEGREDEFTAALGVQFMRLGRLVRVVVDTYKTKALEEKATPNYPQMGTDINEKIYEAVPEWAALGEEEFRTVLRLAGKDWAQAFGAAYSLDFLEAQDWFKTYSLKFAMMVTDETADKVRDIIGQAMSEGWSIGELQTRLSATFRQWATGTVSADDLAWAADRAPWYRSEMIARTELTRAYNAGSQELFTEYGVTKKRWYATFDDRTRPSHTHASGQVRDMDKPFNVGSFQMMYPGDTSLGAPTSEIVMCRCTMIPETG